MTTVIGLDKLNRKLGRLPAAFEEAARLALAEAAQEVVDMMKHLVPVDQGDLRDSIGWTFGNAPKGSLVLLRAGKSRKSGMTAGLRVTIFAGGGKAYYARFVEFGTAAHDAGGLFKGAGIPAIAAQPFFFPAWRAKKRRVKSRVAREMNKAAKRVAAA